MEITIENTRNKYIEEGSIKLKIQLKIVYLHTNRSIILKSISIY